MSGHLYSPLMKAVINDLFKEGFPNDEELCLLKNHQKLELYEKQKLLLHEFRMRADIELRQMEDILKRMPKEEPKITERKVAVDSTPRLTVKAPPPDQKSCTRSPRMPIHESKSQPIRFNRRLLQNTKLTMKRTESRIRAKQVMYNGKPPFRR